MSAQAAGRSADFGAADFRAAVAFLTPFGLKPLGPKAFGNEGTARPSPATMAYFPVVGASLGALIGLAWRISLRRLPPLPAAALVVATDALMTGGLHLDGLADTADGLCAHVPAKARLEIMAEPQVGTFAAVAVGVTLISRTAALASLKASPALLAALYCSSRSVMVIASRALPYAREEGLASAFLPAAAAAHDPENRALPDSALADSALADSAGPDVALQAAVAGAGAALLLASLVAGRRGARAVVTGWISAALVLGMARRRLGGFTGDVLGAAGVVCETTGLLVAAAK